MNIKTGGQRITPESTAVAQLRAMQAEIDELRAALKERDALKAGIERLASEILGPELYANSPCQASDFELVSIYVKDLHKERDALKADAERLLVVLGRIEERLP